MDRKVTQMRRKHIMGKNHVNKWVDVQEVKKNSSFVEYIGSI